MCLQMISKVIFDGLIYNTAIMGVICAKKQAEAEEDAEESHSKTCNTIEDRISEIKEFLSLSGEEAEQIMADSKGQVLSLTDFQIRQYLAKGGFGKVYTAAHRQTGKIYAMKIISKSQLVEESSKLQAISQRLILENLDHPFLVKLHFAFHTASKIYMLVDYVDRGELFYIMRNKGKFSEDEARHFAAEIFAAIEYLHSRNIMYRDLKPQNVLLNEDGHVKITDFGISKVFSQNYDIKTFSMCGTPEYIAPEVLRQKGYSFSSDWFSFGALVYDMLTGRPPLYSKNQLEIVQKKLEKSSVSIPRKMSAQARSFLTGLLKFNPEERLGSKGSDEIKSHPFFASINFDDLVNKRIRPPQSITEFLGNITIDCLAENKSSSKESSLLAKTFRSKLSKDLRLAGFQYNKYQKNLPSEIASHSMNEQQEFNEQI